MKIRAVTKLIKIAGIEYSIIVEQGSQSYGAYLPDIPGCVAIGDNYEEVLTLIQEAIVLHTATDSNF